MSHPLYILPEKKSKQIQTNNFTEIFQRKKALLFSLCEMIEHFFLRQLFHQYKHRYITNKQINRNFSFFI